MFKPTTIIAPIDFSDLSIQALRCAREIAAKFDAEVLVLYAETFVGSPDYAYFSAEALAHAFDEQMAYARRRLEQVIADTIGERVPARALVTGQGPITAILTAGGTHPDCLIVLGTHGRGGFTKLLLGSVSERILRESRRPVLTVRPDGSGGLPEGSVRTILCPVDFNETSARAIEHAGAFAQRFGSKLLTIHLAAPDEPPETAMERLQSWIPPELRERCDPRTLGRDGDPAEQIVRQAATERVDLIVIGAEHKRFYDTTVIGSTTERVTRHAPCPVMTVFGGE
ncbi:MAG TPA: universal stress protein [Thermoanaerobaculia bacterium]|nr:universal stress protein [Thermoanaerobaculia bacterium]